MTYENTNSVLQSLTNVLYGGPGRSRTRVQNTFQNNSYTPFLTVYIYTKILSIGLGTNILNTAMKYLTILLCFFIVACSSKMGIPMPEEVRPVKVGKSTPIEHEVKIQPKVTAAIPKVVKEKSDKPVESKKVDPVFQNLFKAKLAFAVPDESNINDKLQAQLLITPDLEDEVVKQLKIKSNNPTTATIKISREAIAKITATDFEVTNVTPEQQILADIEPTEWLWDLRPKTPGEHDIKLTVTAIVKAAGDESLHHLKTFEKTVKVKITLWQVISGWVNKYWQWVISTLIIPLVIWLYKERVKKKT